MSATAELQTIITRDIETGQKNYAEEYGRDWFNLSPEEEAVFCLSLDDMPSLVAVWCAYEAVLGISDVLPVSQDTAAAFRAEHPWLAEMHKPGGGLSIVSQDSFASFAKLFGIPYRKSHAWWIKNEAYQVRVGILRFSDEPPARESA